MGNIIKETAAKVAGNVTQSVASAVVVFLITTYVLVDIGKKSNNTTGADSLQKEMIVPSLQKPSAGGKNQPSNNVSAVIPTEEPGIQSPGNEQGTREKVVQGGALQSGDGTHETKIVVPKNPIEKKLDATVAHARAKGDTLVTVKKQDTGMHEEVKKVQKRADDVFDELDQEAGKKPPSVR